jgi:hypothetical protein
MTSSASFRLQSDLNVDRAISQPLVETLPFAERILRALL